MKEIVLTKTFIIGDQSDKTSIEQKLYELLYNELLQYNSMYVQVNVEKIPHWLQNISNTSNLELDLKRCVLGFFNSHEIQLKNYEISCKNYLSLPTVLEGVKVLFESEQNKFIFILYFNSHPQFFINVIGSELLVSPISDTVKIYHINMSDLSVSISQMSNLLSS